MAIVLQSSIKTNYQVKLKKIDKKTELSLVVTQQYYNKITFNII